ncbi:MAG: transcription elongation factor GreA [Candidatus Kerfeldbacteria bacterium]|nr:transcription elongation factor GreA [Candidatus Kerfeldbacteria bacterium]
MNERQTFITADGLEKLTEELKHLKTVKRREIAQRIQEAKELGDLSENAEYVEAKNEQAFVEGRVAELEAVVKNAVIIQAAKNAEQVRVGSKVKAKIEDGKIETYAIVGSNEADPKNGRISNESPLGQAFLGRRVGETVTIEAPAGKRNFHILGIA